MTDRLMSEMARNQSPPGRASIDPLRPMQDGGFRHAPVVDRGRVAGMAQWGDFRTSEHGQLDNETDRHRLRIRSWQFVHMVAAWQDRFCVRF